MSSASARQRVRVGFFVVLLGVFAYLTWLIVRPFLPYLLAAVLLAFLLSPAQARLASRVNGRVTAFGLVGLAVAATGAIGALLALSVPADVTDLSQAVERIPGEDRLRDRLEGVLGVDIPVEDVLASLPRRVGELLVGDLTGIVSSATDVFLGLVLFLFVAYYLLVQGDALVDWVAEMLPLAPATTDALVAESHETTWAVLKGHVFVAVLQGIVAGVGLWIVGIPHVVFWTLVMMIAELFPVVGVAAVLGPAVVYLALTERLLAAAFLLVYGLTAVAVVDDYLRAIVVDRQSSLHSATILVGVFGGVYAFGVMGLFYGPIVVGLFQTLVELFDEQVVDGGGDERETGGADEAETGGEEASDEAATAAGEASDGDGESAGNGDPAEDGEPGTRGAGAE